MALTESVDEIIENSNNPLLGKHDSWGRVRLGEIADIQNGFAFKSAKFNKREGVPLIRIRDVVKDDTKTFYQGEYDQEYMVQPGDLLIGMDGDFNCARWRGSPGLLNQRVCRIRLKSGVLHPRLVDYALPGYLRAIHEKTSAVTVKHLSSKTISEIPLPLPPPEQQEEMVAEIEMQFSRLDEAVASLKRVKANLKRYKAAVLKAAVEGKLTEEWRKQNPDVEPASKHLERILAERRTKWEEAELARMRAKGEEPKNEKWKEKYKVPPLVDVAELPELPGGWVWSNLEQLAEAVPHALKAGPFGSALKKSFYVEKGYKIYGQEQVIRGDACYGDYYIDEDRYQSLVSCSVKPGDLLVSLVGTIGRVLILPGDIEPGVINPRLVKVSLDHRVIYPEFLSAYLGSPLVRAIFSIASHGGTMDVLNLTILKSVPIPVPPKEEQQFVLSEIERIETLELNLEQSVSQSSQRAIGLRSSILMSAFSEVLGAMKSVQ